MSLLFREWYQTQIQICVQEVQFSMLNQVVHVAEIVRKVK
jgi:hypothetical protein